VCGVCEDKDIEGVEDRRKIDEGTSFNKRGAQSI
jgi:hypothetical protein